MGQQQRHADGFHQRRFPEFVWPVQHRKPAAELDVRVPNTGEVFGAQAKQSHARFPAASLWVWRSL
jgi:hypothetical protein